MRLPTVNPLIAAGTLGLVVLGGSAVAQVVNHEVPAAPAPVAEPGTDLLRELETVGTYTPSPEDIASWKQDLKKQEERAAKARKDAAKARKDAATNAGTTVVPSRSQTMVKLPPAIAAQPAQPAPQRYYVPNISGSGPSYPNVPAPQEDPGQGQFNLGDITVPTDPSASVRALCHNMPEARICQ
jgi:hypothetical protein